MILIMTKIMMIILVIIPTTLIQRSRVWLAGFGVRAERLAVYGS